MHPTKLHSLITLAQEGSSARRRELLREVTDLFFTGPERHNPVEMGLFDGVMSHLAAEMEEEVRVELASRLGQARVAPAGLLRRLAVDRSITVAQPVLTGRAPLSEAVMLEVARTRGQAHLRALSGRADLSQMVSDTVVERGDDETLGVLLRNAEAPLSRLSAEKVVDRAVNNASLHEAVIERRNLPIDLLNELYFVVEARLRDRIMARNAEVDPAELEKALASGRRRISLRDGALPKDYADAVAYVRGLRAAGRIGPAALAALLRQGERTRFVVALSELSGVDFQTARRIVDNRELDALSIICKASAFDRALYLTFVVLILEPGKGWGVAEQYGRLYQALPQETAMRTLRFWRMRRQTGDVAAA